MFIESHLENVCYTIHLPLFIFYVFVSIFQRESIMSRNEQEHFSASLIPKCRQLSLSYRTVTHSLSYRIIAHPLSYKIIALSLLYRDVIHFLSFSNSILSKNELWKVFWTVFLGSMIYIVLFIIFALIYRCSFSQCTWVYYFGPNDKSNFQNSTLLLSHLYIVRCLVICDAEQNKTTL